MINNKQISIANKFIGKTLFSENIDVDYFKLIQSVNDNFKHLEKIA